MNYYTNLFSPETYEAFSHSDRSVSGFRKRQESWAKRIQQGDRLLCYMTKLSRWFGVLEVASSYYVDDSPLFYPENDPFVVRFKVNPLVWLPKDKTIPIHEPSLWDSLSFTRGMSHESPAWTGKVRTSLNQLSATDGKLLESLLSTQLSGGMEYPIDEDAYQRLLPKPVRREDKIVYVTVPDDEEPDVPESDPPIRESHLAQARLAEIGEAMGFRVWLPKQDRTAVLQSWTPNADTLLSNLPLNYDDRTLRTIEQIDVLWLKGRAIIRAFEVEHTTAIYSGILRMADLLALQPNMDIRLHIVAPETRKQKVFDEIRRPVFSLFERRPLAESCSFLSYDSLEEIVSFDHLRHTKESILDDYTEEPG